MTRQRHLRSGNNALQAPPGVPIRPGKVTTAPSGTPAANDVGKIVYEPTTGVYVANADEWVLVGATPDPATTFNLGPWYRGDALSGTGTHELELGYIDGAGGIDGGTLGASTENAFRMAEDGAVIGAFVMTDSARLGGTATISVLLSGVDTAFATGAVVLDGTNTLRSSAFDSTGVAFVAGDTIGVRLTTVGYTPTLGDLTAFLIVRYGAASGGGGSGSISDGDKGDITVSSSGTVWTLDDTAIQGKSTVTAVGSDYILISDTSDANALKKALASDLAGSGSSSSLSDILMLGGM